jgi:hypothetical protein
MPTNSNLPRTTKGLRAWLRGTTEGRATLNRMAKEFLEGRCRTCQKIRPYPKVLVVLRRIGDLPGAEVYAEEGVNLRFLELPDIPDDGDFVELTERLIELELPRNWRRLVNLPVKRIHRETFRGVTISEAIRYEEDLRLIRLIKGELR